ncbi:MAG: nucleoside permease [bacterium]|nr:nucleoside permease [bacterium]
MASETMSMNVRIKLSAMMFFQFMLFAAFWVPLSGYLSDKLGFTVSSVTMIMGTMAYGCMLSPIIGMIADRHFASQKVLAVLNALGAVFLGLAAFQTDPTMMFVFLLIYQLCYMPTWGLTASIAMTHSPAEKFPQIRAFGSFGWVSAAIFSLFAYYILGFEGFDKSNLPLLCGAGVSVVAAVLAMTLPHTPPPAKGEPASVIDALGLKAASLMKQFDFLAFIVISTLVMIPFMLYFNLNSMFLNDKGFEFITLTMSLGQFAEIFFMLLIPLALAKMGVKWAMTIGLATMAVRYASFWMGSATDSTVLYYVAIIIHGIIFGFFFIGGQIYVDKKAPTKIRAQAQGFLFLITFGIGTLLSMQVNNALITAHTDTSVVTAEDFALTDGSTFSTATTIQGAKLDDLKIFDRVLNDNEFAFLAASGKKAENIKAEAAGGDKKVAIDKGLVENPATTPVTKAFTFDTKLTLPKDDPKIDTDNKLTGTIFTVGTGDKAVTLAVKDNLLTYKAGSAEIVALRVKLPRDKEKEKSIHLAGTFDGKEIKLYVNGGVFEMRDWGPIWKITTFASVGLLVLFVLCFHYHGGKGEDAEEAPAEDAPAAEIEETPAAEEAPAAAPAADEAPAEEAAAADEAQGDDAE